MGYKRREKKERKQREMVDWMESAKGGGVMCFSLILVEGSEEYGGRSYEAHQGVGGDWLSRAIILASSEQLHNYDKVSTYTYIQIYTHTHGHTHWPSVLSKRNQVGHILVNAKGE